MEKIRLEENFTLDEFLRTSFDVDLKPTPKHKKNLEKLCKEILQPLRDAFGVPIKITSGYRNKELQKLIPGASKTSQHLRGEAADFVFSGKGYKKKELTLALLDSYYWIYHNCKFGQLILYMVPDGKYHSYGWVHVSLGSKKEALVKFNGRLYDIEKMLSLNT